MKVLVTGGAGFIGSHVVDAYIEAGHEVVILDNLVSGKKENVNPKAEFVKGDITNRSLVDLVFEKYGPFDVLNHFAAQKSVTESVKDPVFDAQTNIIGSLNLFEAFEYVHKYGAKRIIFSSTGGALYGDKVEIPTPEGAKIQPESPYGIAKFAIENYLRFYDNFGVKTIVLRYANVFGPRQDPHGEAGVVSIFCEKILAGDDLVVFGNGKQTRDFVYVRDIVQANLLALSAEESIVCNIGTGVETPVNDLVKELKEIAKQTNLPESKVIYQDARVGELKRSVLSSKLAKSKLGWQPKTTFVDGLKETLESFK